MIQRIQSVYLLLVAILLVVALCIPVGSYLCPNGYEAGFANLGVRMEDGSLLSSWGMFAILLLSAIVALGTIFLFRNRILQIRMTIFNSLLLVGYYLAFVAFLFVFRRRLVASFHLSWGLCLPFVSLVLNYLPIRAIGKDEVLVRAADRLR